MALYRRGSCGQTAPWRPRRAADAEGVARSVGNSSPYRHIRKLADPLRLYRHLLLLVITLGHLLPPAALAAPPQPDPDMKRLLDTWTSLSGRPIEGLNPAQARSQPSLQTAVSVLARKLGKSSKPQSVARVETIKVDGAEGELPARLYTPAGEGPFPVLVYFHSGGWVLGGLEDADASARALANAAGCLVVSVAYRQAPEHPYPAAVLDAHAAFNDIVDRASQLGGDRRRVAVGGEGSGANLAVVVCLMAMEKRTPMPIHQLLICPITDTNFDTLSYRRNAQARPYSRASMQWFFRHYLSKPGQASSPYVSVLKKSAVDMPAATVIVAELDPVASEGQAYHQHLLDSAVDSQLGLYHGVTADFFGTGAVVGKAREAVKFAGRRLQKAFVINRPYARPQQSGSRRPATQRPAPAVAP